MSTEVKTLPCRTGRRPAPGGWKSLVAPGLSAVCIAVFLSLAAWAQSAAGRILGTVTDQSGASVSGALVVVTDVARGTSRTLTTDAAGAYVAPELEPGIY